MPKTAVLKTSLDLMYYSGASRALQPVLGGSGAIFMLHHVLPGGGTVTGFAPNSVLEVTPEFLDRTLTTLSSEGFEFVSLDDAVIRLKSGVTTGRRFAVFTLDDGYRDNLVFAQPVFKKHRCPYTVYLAPKITEGKCEIWWRALEAVISSSVWLQCRLGDDEIELPLETDGQKWTAWNQLYWPLRNMEQHEQRLWIRELASDYGIDLDRLCRMAAMDWTEVRELATDPLCTIGAHTMNHYAVSRLGEQEAFDEMVKSADRIERELGRRPRHLSFPYGDETSAGPRDFALAAKAGFASAVTTRKGMIFPQHASHLHALPRFSLAGQFQSSRHVRTLASGLPFYLFNGLRKLNVG